MHSQPPPQFVRSCTPSIHEAMITCHAGTALAGHRLREPCCARKALSCRQNEPHPAKCMPTPDLPVSRNAVRVAMF